MAHLIVVVTILLSLLTTNAVSTRHSLRDEHLRKLLVAQQGRGIIMLAFDPTKSPSSSLQILGTVDAGYLPQWLFPYNNMVYSMSRSQFPDATSTSGGIFAFESGALQQGKGPLVHDGELVLISNTSSDGLGGVYCGVGNDGRTLSAVDIDGSTVSIHPLSESGQIGAASYIFKYNLSHPGPGTNGSQIQSNPHEAIFDPSGQWMVVPDRGADHLYIYRAAGPYDVSQVQNITLLPGTGPRHATFRVFDSSKTFMYLVSELDNTVRVFLLDGVNNDGVNGCTTDALSITLLQTASTLGPGSNRTAPNNQDLAAEVAISNDGKYLYVSNRNTIHFTSDTLAIYSVHPGSDTEHLVYLGQNITYGKTPRHFSLSADPENQYIAVGNEVTNDVVILERNIKTGFIDGLVGNITLGNFDVTTTKGPTGVIWI